MSVKGGTVLYVASAFAMFVEGGIVLYMDDCHRRDPFVYALVSKEGPFCMLPMLLE